MISLLLLSHGSLAKAFEDSLKYSSNCKIDISSYCLYEDDDLEEFEKTIENAISEKEKAFDVIVGADLLLGTPANIAYKLLKRHDFNIIGNINLQEIIFINNNFQDFDDPKELLKETIKTSNSKIVNKEMFGETL